VEGAERVEVVEAVEGSEWEEGDAALGLPSPKALLAPARD